MRHIDVEWIHSLNENPVRLVSEIDSDNFEIRKLEFYRNGQVDFSDADRQSGSARLGIAEVPNISEINSQPEFYGSEINSNEFERLWQQYVPSNS